MTSRQNLARDVEARAAGRCEYCRMHQSLQGATFHVEHIVPRSRDGLTLLNNLAWASPRLAERPLTPCNSIALDASKSAKLRSFLIFFHPKMLSSD